MLHQTMQLSTSLLNLTQVHRLKELQRRCRADDNNFILQGGWQTQTNSEGLMLTFLCMVTSHEVYSETAQILDERVDNLATDTQQTESTAMKV